MRRLAIFGFAAALLLASCGGEPIPSDNAAPTGAGDSVEGDEGIGQTSEDDMTPTPPIRTDRAYGGDGYPPELTGMVEMAIAADASSIQVFGGYEYEPYDRDQSVDLIMIAKK